MHQADQEVGSTPSIGTHAKLDKIRPFLRYFTALVAKEIYNDIRFLTEPDENVWWYDGQRVEFRTPNYAKILRIMQSQPSVTIGSLREQLGINKSAVQRLLSSLKEKGYIEARNNAGGWRVNKESACHDSNQTAGWLASRHTGPHGLQIVLRH